MEEDELVARYRLESSASVEEEAHRRIAEIMPMKERIRLRSLSLKKVVHEDVDLFLKACFARLGAVAAALDGHGGGIALVSHHDTENGLDLVLDLTGACLSCGAAPGTLSGVRTDLEEDEEISRVRFDAGLLETFDELGREFVLAHGDVEFV